MTPSADRTWLLDEPPPDTLPLVWLAPPDAARDVVDVSVDGRWV